MTSITPDNPIQNPSLDQFRRWPFAQRIAQTLAFRKDPSSIIIGIYGSWGDGKTTVLNFIQHELKQHNNVVTYTFNPWRFSDEPKMLLGFFHSLADALGKSETTKTEKIGDWIGKYLPTVASAFGQGETVENISKLLSSVELEELKDRINEILKGEGKRVVVLIDDIDRLDKNEIQSIFRLVKLNADFVNTAYVLAFDDEMVAAALQEKYSGSGPESGRNFLEKIIQVPLDLPSIPSVALRQFAFSKIDQALHGAEITLLQEDAQIFVRGYVDGIEIRVKTPRMATRYGNILAFSLPIMKGEVHPVDLMWVEGIRLFYPKVYETIRRNPDVFLGESSSLDSSREKEKRQVRDIIESALVDLNSDEKSAAINLLQLLFPRLKGVFGNTFYGNEWGVTWARSKRVASKEYFPRYFSYSIPENDVSDVILDQFLLMLEGKPIVDAAEAFDHLVKTETSEALVSKLRLRSKKISANASKTLASIVADRGNLFPNPEQPFLFRGAFSQAAMLISDLIINIPQKEESYLLAEELVKKAEPITFAIEVVRWFREASEDTHANGFSKEDKTKLKKILASRINELSSKIDLFSVYPDDIGSILSVWAAWRSHEETAHYLKKVLDENASLVNILLNSFVPTAWTLETGVGRKGDLERDIYDLIIKVLDSDDVITTLEKLYGDKLYVQDYPFTFEETESELLMAQQFAWIHINLLKEEEKRKNQTDK